MTAGDDATATSVRTFDDLDTPFTRWLVRWRFLFFAIVAVMVVLPFNGQWRIGLDSALYRGVAENLVAGRGYTFAGLRQTQIYPGLPFILAGFHKITASNTIWPALVLMNVCALLSMAGIYQLIRVRFPVWIAVVVTCGVGMNVKFIQQAHEIMTDMPFLLGVVAIMLGWEWLGKDAPKRRTWIAIGLLVSGLILAAVMRPTFWVVALALILTCLWNLVRYREKRSLIALSALVVVGISFAVCDPRVRGFNILQGGYEREFLSLTNNLVAQVSHNAPDLFGKEITETFFGETLTLFALPVAVLILTGTVIVLVLRPLWGLQVFILCGVMLMLSDAPRYLLMVLPTLWVGYVLILLYLTRWFRDVYRDWCLFVMFSLANFINIAGYTAFMYEQHHGDFQHTYRDGDFLRLQAMADVIREKVPEEAVIIGPHGNVLAYLSGRNVRNARLLGLEAGAVSKYPSLVAKHNPTYMVGPSNAVRYKDPAIARLVDKGVIRPIKLISTVDDPHGTLWLATCEVVVPAGNWKDLPTTRAVVYADKPTRRPAFAPEELARRELKAKRERKEIRAKRERKAIRAAREAARMRTTQPATIPSTQSPQSYRVVPLWELGLPWESSFPSSRTQDS